MKKLNKVLYLLGRNKQIFTYLNKYGFYYPNEKRHIPEQNNLILGYVGYNIIIASLYQFHPESKKDQYCTFTSKPKVNTSFTFYKFLYKLYKVNYYGNTDKNLINNTWHSFQ